MKGFYAFGDKLPGNRQNPNFEFSSLKADAQVVSAIDGLVVEVKAQPESSDSEVFIIPEGSQRWVVGYDHLVNLKVQKGAKVKAGDLIGNPAIQNNGLYRFEIQINEENNGVTTHHCPTTLFAPAVADKLTNELKMMMGEWEAVSKLDLYDTASQNPIGCIKQTLTPKEAEGR